LGKVNKFGLRERITVIAIGVMLVAITSIALVSSYLFNREYAAALQSRSVAIATSLKLQLERLLQLDLRLENLIGFDEQCREVVEAYGGIEYAMVVGRDGTILFHNDPGRRGQPADHKLTILRQTAPRSVIEDARNGGKSYVTIVPVVSPAGEHQASVVVGFPAAQVTGKARQMAFVTLGLGFGFLLVAIFGLVTMLSALVTNPLGRLIDTLGGIRAASDLSRRVRVGTTGDIARLAGAFNRMMEELQSTVEELQQRTSELQRANQAKDEFLSVVSHELRTPLNVVVGYSAMLREGLLGEVNPRQREALAKVLGRAKDQLGMINSILEAAQIGAGAVTVLRKNVNLSEILDEMRVGYDIPRNKEIALHWDYPPELLVAVDGEKLKHILQNIIDNAIKFTEKGSITISVRHVEEPGLVQFKITDTGIGIPKALLPTIFEKFRQADSSDNRSFEGVGLGLYIVKCLIDLMGGRVEVESEEGKGSTFTLAIPVEVRRKGMQHGAEEPAR
jgi:signal transduction histidine kinase